MTSDGLWVPHARRKSRVYQPRHRRDCLGELIQIDGSHHDWFEGRAPKCCLLVFIDDATGRLMHCGSASQKQPLTTCWQPGNTSSSMGSRYRCTVTNTQYFASVVRRNAIPPLPSSDVCFMTRQSSLFVPTALKLKAAWNVRIRHFRIG